MGSFETNMRVLFVCVGNSCRSQMAEGWARHYGLEAFSAGTHPASQVATNSVIVMEEMGIDISMQSPSLVDDVDVSSFDQIISMGCGVSCPTIKIDADWEIGDPFNQSLDVYRAARDIIHEKVRALVNSEE